MASPNQTIDKTIKDTKTVLDANNIPKVDIDFMNNTHFEELELVEKLGKQILDYQTLSETGNPENTQASEQAISRLLNNWLEHTIAHFERENKLMQDTGFPAYPVHASEHEIALEKLKNLISTWEKNKDIDQLADYVFTHWPDWFNTHVNTMDMMTAKFAVMNGFDPRGTPDQ